MLDHNILTPEVTPNQNFFRMGERVKYSLVSTLVEWFVDNVTVFTILVILQLLLLLVLCSSSSSSYNIQWRFHLKPQLHNIFCVVCFVCQSLQ